MIRRLRGLRLWRAFHAQPRASDPVDQAVAAATVRPLTSVEVEWL